MMYLTNDDCRCAAMVHLQFFVEHCYSYFVPRLPEISFVKYSVLQSTFILGGTPKFSQI